MERRGDESPDDGWFVEDSGRIGAGYFWERKAWRYFWAYWVQENSQVLEQ